MVHDVEVKTVPLADYAVPRAGLGEPIGSLVEALLKGTGAGKGEPAVHHWVPGVGQDTFSRMLQSMIPMYSERSASQSVSAASQAMRT
jgi:hypothetical protein